MSNNTRPKHKTCKLILRQILAVLLFSSSLSAQSESPRKTITVTCDYWPGSCERDGSGFYFDIIKAIYLPKGYTIQHQIEPFKRGLKLIEEGKADIMAAAYKLPEREKSYHYPSIRLVTEYVTAMRLTQTPKVKEQASGKVTFIRGYEYNHLIKNGEADTIGRVDQGIKMLKSGRIDYFINPFYDSYMQLDKLIAEDKNIQWQDFSFDYMDSSPIYLLFQKNRHGSELASTYDQQAKILHANGELKKIFTKQKIGQYYFYFPEITGQDTKTPFEEISNFSIPKPASD